jgi:hypothetical protein
MNGQDFVKKDSFEILFHNPDRIAIEASTRSFKPFLAQWERTDICGNSILYLYAMSKYTSEAPEGAFLFFIEVGKF